MNFSFFMGSLLLPLFILMPLSGYAQDDVQSHTHQNLQVHALVHEKHHVENSVENKLAANVSTVPQGNDRHSVNHSDKAYNALIKELPKAKLSRKLDIVEQLNQLKNKELKVLFSCLLYTSPSPRDKRQSRMPSSA